MRKFGLLLFLLAPFILLKAQNMNQQFYTQKWETVEDLLSKGLNASAAKEIRLILNQARTEQNTDQYIKSICMYLKSTESLSESADSSIISFFHQELKSSQFPAKQLLYSMLGTLYQDYYEKERWEILERTSIELSPTSKKLIPDGTEDLETWTADQFFQAAYYCFHASLTEEEASKNYPLVKVKGVFLPGENTAKLWPTLYDYLAHRAIDFFANDEIELTKPAYAFELKDSIWYAPALDFIPARLNVKDSLQSKVQVVKLYQKLLQFHLDDTDPSALIDADLARIKYVHQHAVGINKNEYYIRSLLNVVKKYPNHPGAAYASYLYAEYLFQGTQTQGRSAHKNSESPTAHTKKRAAAKDVCDEILKKFPRTEAAMYAEQLLQQILAKQIELITEEVLLPNRPALARLSYQNVSQVYCKVIPMTLNELKEFNQDYLNNSKKVLTGKAIRSWSINLPRSNDFETHSTEINIESLPLGCYALFISDDPQFESQKIVSINLLQVTDLTYIPVNESKQQRGIWVVHRSTGEPLSGVTVRLYKQEYDYKTYKNKLIEVAKLLSDDKGFVSLKNYQDNSSLIPELSKGDDQFYTPQQIYLYHQDAPQQNLVRTFLFTDRSICRPGQTIYFKGIMVQSAGVDPLKHELLKQRKATISLMDVNHQVVETLEVSTNEFGSFSASFQAPQGLLTGAFHLSAEGGQAYFNIEEYKRPKFEVTFDTIRSAYRLNDQIRIKGLAKAFAGNAIDGASVKFRVLRQARFPYYWCFYRWGQPSSPSMEIAQGQLVTSADGSFEIEFDAIPDLAVSPETKPVFDYQIIADVTDLNGETRSGKSNVSIAYQRLLLEIISEESRAINDFNAVEIKSTNLAGVFNETEVILSLKKLKAPDRVLRKRLWEKVEFNLIPEADFRKDFPLDEYDGESDKMNWEEEKTVWTKNFKTTSSGVEYLQKTGSGEGWYVLEAKAKDSDGLEVIDKKYIRLFGKDAVSALRHEALVTAPKYIKTQPGNKINLGFASAFDKVFVLYQLERKGLSKTQWEILESKRSLQYLMDEDDRGGFFWSGVFVKDNRFYSFDHQVQVPFSQKELQLKMLSFRDKILPGSEQEWRIEIKGSQSEKVASEMLTSMYDASLDAFKSHTWNLMPLYTDRYRRYSLQHPMGFGSKTGMSISRYPYLAAQQLRKIYPSQNWWGLDELNHRDGYYMMEMSDGNSRTLTKAAAAPAAARMMSDKDDMNSNLSMDSIAQAPKVNDSKDASSAVPLRSDFKETAFFFPQLRTDEEGNIQFAFKAPEALTKWKLMAFAHTEDLAQGMLTESSRTSKEVMIVPNTPRFMREGDKMEYRAKISNLSSLDMLAEVRLKMMHPNSQKSVDGMFKNTQAVKLVKLKAGESQAVQWDIEIPKDFIMPVIIQTWVTAKSKDGSVEWTDGEQNLVPVLTNDMLVTETWPLNVKYNSEKNFKLEKLINSGSSSTLRHYNLSVEFTANPAWYAIQSLPYLTDYPYECAEQRFNRYYSNVLATHIAQSNPKIHEVFNSWEEKDSSALLSNLQKNQELKNALLEETPWVLQAQSEEAQKKNIALLFDLNRMSKELERSTRELAQMQTPNGGFAWFKGMPDDRYITQYIVTGIGRLLHLGVREVGQERRIMKLAENALPYLDAKIKEDYDELIRYKANLNEPQISYFQIQYLYMRSFFSSQPIEGANQKAFNFYKNQAAQYWLKQNKYMQAMSAIALNRFNQKEIARDIIASLRENAILHDEMGMYWKSMNQSYWWYEAPIEAQSVMIEAFDEVAQSEKEVDALKIWLLKNKQTNHWKTTKSTADACYALLLKGTYWLAAEPDVEIKMGTMLLDMPEKEAGTGYFKMSMGPELIKPERGNVYVKVQSQPDKVMGIQGTSWGAVYWQYFEQLDKITAAETPLKLKKQIYRVDITEKGETLVPLSKETPLKLGDKMMVRIELRVDRPMEYVHMKDMRAACFEPIHVLSQYQYQGGLGYYESTKDLATHFFFNFLPKGTYVFEYPMFVTNKGEYSNGIAQIQCMYAPEFSSHSEGIRVIVK